MMMVLRLDGETQYSIDEESGLTDFSTLLDVQAAA
jgi:hypothetical protein